MSLQATFVATLVDEWIRCGLRHAVIAPGSRSTPLALALARANGIEVHVHVDERSAAFVALGIGIETGVPAVVVTTSGTAAVELHPAVVEASMARIPMLVCTADRPPELRDIGAAQTIDQTHLFGSAARWFFEPGVAAGFDSSAWRSLASRAWCETLGSPPGPVHLNLAFVDPLIGEADELPKGRDEGRPWHQLSRVPSAPDHSQIEELANELRVEKGVIVAGGVRTDPAAVAELANATGWPVLADPRSGCRRPHELTVAAFDALLRDQEFALTQRPEVVLRIGDLPSSKVLGSWIATSGARQVFIDPDGYWSDPQRLVDKVVAADPASVCLAVARNRERAERTRWTSSWMEAERKAQRAIDEYLSAMRESGTLTEPGVARRLAELLRDDSTLFVSSSMPIRDMEWFSPPVPQLRVVSNRGANGIDGVVSSAVGVALTGRATALLIGDLAFVHDTNGLLGLAARNLDLTIVVIDNRGGGIFSFLPQASSIEERRFEQLFGTPQDVDLVGLVSAHGLIAMRAHDPEGFDAAIEVAQRAPGTHVIIVSTDRARNVAVHDEMHQAIASALALQQ